MDFEWDPDKAAANHAKHGISFLEATEVFRDTYRLERVDDRHDYGETRYQVLGQTDRQLVLLVVTTDRHGRTRIISARYASRNERAAYYAHHP